LFEGNEYLWTSEKNNYVLIKSSEESYSIFNINNKAILIIENDEEFKFVINQMKQNGNRIIRIELLDYLLNGRPIPKLIAIKNNKIIYRCPDTGEKFELGLEPTCHIEPTFDLAIKWSDIIPLAKQIIYLKKAFPSIVESTPDLLYLARNTKEFVFAKYLSHCQAERVLTEGKSKGLDIYVIKSN